MKRCVSLIGAVMLLVVTAAAQDWPRYETSLDYTFTRFTSNTNAPDFNAHGGNGQFAVNFNRWFSGVIDAGAVYNSDIHFLHWDTTVANFLAGPRLTVRRSRVAPYVQVLLGGVYAATSGAAPADALPFEAGIAIPPGTFIRSTRAETGFALTAGGGLDVKISRHFSFRPFEVDYYMTRLRNFRTLNDNTQNNLQASAGFTFTFGGEEPTPPPPPTVQPHTKTCADGTTVPAGQECPKRNVTLSISTSARELCPGDSAQVNASIAGGDSSQLNFQWSVNGEPINQAHSLEFGTTGREPGTYTVKLTVNGANFNPASAQTAIIVREYRPPVVAVEASPSEIQLGEKSMLSARCTGQCGGRILPPAFTASDGSVEGDQFDSTAVQFDSSRSEQRKSVTITATCADNRSTGTGTTHVTVIKKGTAAAIRLPDVLFDKNSARINNCGKRILLEQLRSYFERDSSGTVVLVGHVSSDEGPELAQQRVAHAAAVITAGTGVCLALPQSQVLVSWPGVDQNGVNFEPSFCSSSVKGGLDLAQMRRVEVWFVPTGGENPPSFTDGMAASSLSLSGLGCPK